MQTASEDFWRSVPLEALVGCGFFNRHYCLPDPLYWIPVLDRIAESGYHPRQPLIWAGLWLQLAKFVLGNCRKMVASPVE